MFHYHEEIFILKFVTIEEQLNVEFEYLKKGYVVIKRYYYDNHHWLKLKKI